MIICDRCKKLDGNRDLAYFELRFDKFNYTTPEQFSRRMELCKDCRQEFEIELRNLYNKMMFNQSDN